MRISPISNNNYKQNFGSLIIKDGTEPLLNKLTLNELKQLKQWEKELENTKEFDLSLAPHGHRLFIKHEHKTNPVRYNSEGPLLAGPIPQNTVMPAASIDIEDCGDYYWYKLVFGTKERAKEVYSNLTRLKNNYNNNKTIFNYIKWAVQGVKYLEEGYGHDIEKQIENNKNKPNKESILDLLILQKETEKKHNCKVIIEGINDEKTVNAQKPTVEKSSQEEKITTDKNNKKEDSFLDKLLAKIGLQRIKNKK